MKALESKLRVFVCVYMRARIPVSRLCFTPRLASYTDRAVTVRRERRRITVEWLN